MPATIQGIILERFLGTFQGALLKQENLALKFDPNQPHTQEIVIEVKNCAQLKTHPLKLLHWPGIFPGTGTGTLIPVPVPAFAVPAVPWPGIFSGIFPIFPGTQTSKVLLCTACVEYPAIFPASFPANILPSLKSLAWKDFHRDFHGDGSVLVPVPGKYSAMELGGQVGIKGGIIDPAPRYYCLI